MSEATGYIVVSICDVPIERTMVKIVVDLINSCQHVNHVWMRYDQAEKLLAVKGHMIEPLLFRGIPVVVVDEALE